MIPVRLVAVDNSIGMEMTGKVGPRLMVTAMNLLVAVETTFGMAMAGKIGPRLMSATSLGAAHNTRPEVTTIGKVITTKIGPIQMTMATPVKEALEQIIMTDAADPGVI